MVVVAAAAWLPVALVATVLRPRFGLWAVDATQRLLERRAAAFRRLRLLHGAVAGRHGWAERTRQALQLRASLELWQAERAPRRIARRALAWWRRRWSHRARVVRGGQRAALALRRRLLLVQTLRMLQRHYCPRTTTALPHGLPFVGHHAPVLSATTAPRTVGVLPTALPDPDRLRAVMEEFRALSFTAAEDAAIVQRLAPLIVFHPTVGREGAARQGGHAAAGSAAAAVDASSAAVVQRHRLRIQRRLALRWQLTLWATSVQDEGTPQ